MLSICSQGRWLGLNRSQMSWIPEPVPCSIFPLTPNPPLNGGKKDEPRLTDFTFHIFLFGRRRWGSGWGYSWAGIDCGLGVGCGLEDKQAGRMCNHLLQACGTPLQSDLSVLLHSWQPRLRLALGGSALQLGGWLLKQNHHNTCQLCFLHALW